MEEKQSWASRIRDVPNYNVLFQRPSVALYGISVLSHLSGNSALDYSVVVTMAWCSCHSLRHLLSNRHKFYTAIIQPVYKLVTARREPPVNNTTATAVVGSASGHVTVTTVTLSRSDAGYGACPHDKRRSGAFAIRQRPSSPEDWNGVNSLERQR